jgi:CHAT domain-containing protein/tetratricopeptide (TPR) repeat protein
VISLNDRRQGVLSQSDPIRTELPRGRESRWSFDGRSGQRIAIQAESYEFDVYLLLLDPKGKQLAWSDDNGGFANADIETLLENTGRYTAIVCGANADQFGTYWLSVSEGERRIDLTRSGAENYFSKGIEWSQRENSSRGRSWLNLMLGQYFAQRRDWNEAEKHFSDSVQEAPKTEFTYCQWAVALERGKMFARRRRYDQAIRHFQQALEISKQLRAAQEAEALVSIEFGNMYYSIDRRDLAGVHFRSAAKQAEEYGIQSTLLKLYTSLSVFSQSQDKEKAVEYAEMAYGLREGVDPALELKALYTLAGTDLFLKPERSPQRSHDGFALAAETRDKAHQLGCVDDEVAALTLMSMAKYAAGDSKAMIDFAGEAFALTDPADENPNPRRVALQLLADGEIARADSQAALNWCLKALQTVETAWANENIEELRRELLSQSRAICTQIIRNLYSLNASHPNVEYARQAFDYAERSRSRSLLDQLMAGESHKQIPIDGQVLSRDRELLERISAVRGKLVLLRASNYASRETSYDLEQQRANLIAERMKLQAEIAASLGNWYRAAQLSPLGAEQVQKKLAENYPNSVVLYYQLGIQESFLIVSDHRRFEFFKLPDWTTISKAVNEWRADILRQQNLLESDEKVSDEYENIAYRLYEILVKPAAPLIKGRDLIIVPSDSLCGLAFEGLVLRKPDASATARRVEYLVERHAISYAPSMSVLAGIESRWVTTKPGNRILLLGDASSEGTDDSLAIAAPQIRSATQDRLPAARREVLAVAKLAQQHDISPTIWLGSEANEEKFKSSDLSAYRFIHIATHGVSDHQDGESSSLALSPDPEQKQDGILTSAEIADLRLTCDLVALSGCETSVGQIAGAEGIVGLSRTFLLAGARSVCGSLWPVEDSSTEKLMTSFYRLLIVERLSKSQALRLAKLASIKRGVNPSRWAPFILVGSSR